MMLFNLSSHISSDAVFNGNIIPICWDTFDPNSVVTGRNQQFITLFIERSLICSEILQHADDCEHSDKIHYIL